MEFSSILKLKLDLAKYLEEEKFFTAEKIDKAMMMMTTQWIYEFYERVNKVYDEYFATVESRIEGLTTYVVDQQTYIILNFKKIREGPDMCKALGCFIDAL